MHRLILIQRGLNWRPGQRANLLVDEDYNEVSGSFEAELGQPFYHPGRETPGTLVRPDGAREPAVLLGITYQD